MLISAQGLNQELQGPPMYPIQVDCLLPPGWEGFEGLSQLCSAQIHETGHSMKIETSEQVHVFVCENALIAQSLPPKNKFDSHDLPCFLINAQLPNRSRTTDVKCLVA